MDSAETVLFVCSGNFYRSRFAEALFNHRALSKRLSWRAESRGFSPHLATDDLSPFARAALELRNIPLALTRAKPARLEREDLARATLVICLKEAEHRPLMTERFPEWADRVRYWHVHDIDVEPPSRALPDLERQLLAFTETLPCRRHASPAPRHLKALEF